jgi:hypothetical protein
MDRKSEPKGASWKSLIKPAKIKSSLSLRRPQSMSTLALSFSQITIGSKFSNEESKETFNVEGSNDEFWYDETKVLGIGCSASVYQCFSNMSNQDLAVKVFNITDDSVNLTA